MTVRPIPPGPLVGLSLSFCVKDIIDGLVELDRVRKIIAGTFYTDRDVFWVGMKTSYCHTYWRADPQRAHAIAMQLWDEGKIEQPRCRGKEPPTLTDGHWRDVNPAGWDDHAARERSEPS